MNAVLVAATGALGVHLLWTAAAQGRRGLRPAGTLPRPHRRRHADRVLAWLRQAGIIEAGPAEFVAASLVVGTAGAVATWMLFGGVLPGLAAGLFAALAPAASFRVRRSARMAAAHDAWPQMIEEIRLLTGAAGRSIPQALFEVGRRGPVELRPAFEAAHREWLLSTDFAATVARLRALLADPTADVTCETLLVAHELGGAGLDRRLAELAEDRRLDNLSRKDARAKQAGVRFARRFVVLVPAGMAFAGLSLGDGRDAYRTPTGQVLVVAAIALIAACWAWSGRMLRLPEQRRVFVP